MDLQRTRTVPALFAKVGRLLALLLALSATPGNGSAGFAQTLLHANQGSVWTAELRRAYHRIDQGSRLISYAWLEALEQTSRAPFLEDGLARYGFLGDTDSGTRLPLGLSLARTSRGTIAGFTCSACHTREIEVDGNRWRIEGAPALIDFQRFLSDLDAAVRRTLAQEETFARFAARVVGADPKAQSKLRTEVELWSQRFTAYVSALPEQPWGPGRLDAFGLIFNQVGGLDVGDGPSGLILENIEKADAPVRYPFLWNAPFQDKTDWPGFAENGDDWAAWARNVSEALGVFATFRPQPARPNAALNRDYLADNSEDLAGLQKLETDLVALKPPVWPWTVDARLAARGKLVFEHATTDGGCRECHEAKPGLHRGARPTLATPVLDVGTDTKMWARLGRTVRTGRMAGAFIPGDVPLGATDSAARLLRTTVVGIVVQAAQETRAATPSPGVAAAMPGAANGNSNTAANLSNAYEARVLAGIWAAAPYLHNGSVPTLEDLLKPAAQRPLNFAVGEGYDLAGVGLARHQAPGSFVFQATGCDAKASGNSNCGHEYGTKLSDDDKRALLEYLKTL